MRRAGRSSSVHTSTAARGPRAASWPSRYASVRPVSTMSSTTTTSRPLMSESRSWRIRTRPESGAKREIAMKSIVDVDVADRAGEVGEEDQRALEHADEHDAVGMVGCDLAAEPVRRARRSSAASSRTDGVDGSAAAASVVERAPHGLAQQRGAQPPAEPGELAERLRPCAPAPRDCAGGGTAAAPARTGSLRARRTCGTCGGGGARCRGA